MSEPTLPLPNDEVGPGIVIASIWQNDDADDGPIFGLLLVLHPSSPYYGIYEITQAGDRWDYQHLATHVNIVPAVAGYIEAGGGY